MSIPAALQFIAAVRDRPELADRVRALGRDAALVELVSLGAELGLVFGPDDLRAAHRHDWTMRRVRYGAASPG